MPLLVGQEVLHRHVPRASLCDLAMHCSLPPLSSVRTFLVLPELTQEVGVWEETNGMCTFGGGRENVGGRKRRFEGGQRGRKKGRFEGGGGGARGRGVREGGGEQEGGL